MRALEDMTDYDLYDVLGELGYGLSPRTCVERAEAFGYKHAEVAEKPATGNVKDSPRVGRTVRPRRDGCFRESARL